LFSASTHCLNGPGKPRGSLPRQKFARHESGVGHTNSSLDAKDPSGLYHLPIRTGAGTPRTWFERLGCRRTSRRPITYARLRRDPRGRDGSLRADKLPAFHFLPRLRPPLGGTEQQIGRVEQAKSVLPHLMIGCASPVIQAGGTALGLIPLSRE